LLNVMRTQMVFMLHPIQFATAYFQVWILELSASRWRTPAL
jgi:hypothetical protein